MCAVVQQYDNCRCAWNVLFLVLGIFLEQYDNWQMVFQGVVAFYAAPGKLPASPAWGTLGSTIIAQSGKYDNCAWRLLSLITAR